MSDNPYQPPQSTRGGLQLGDEPLQFAQSPQRRNAGPEGLGGWLILVAIGLVLTLLRNFAILRTVHLPVFTSGAWEALTTPGSEHFHPLMGPMILFESLGNAGFMAFAVVLLVLFFRKSRRFPRAMIALYAANACFAAIDLILAFQIPMIAQEDRMGSVRLMIQAVVGAAIWIPYMLSSKRVRNTFVEPRRQAPRREPQWQPSGQVSEP